MERERGPREMLRPSEGELREAYILADHVEFFIGREPPKYVVSFTNPYLAQLIRSGQNTHPPHSAPPFPFPP